MLSTLLRAWHPREQKKFPYSDQAYIHVGRGREPRPIGKLHCMLSGDNCNVKKESMEERAGEAQGVCVCDGVWVG